MPMVAPEQQGPSSDTLSRKLPPRPVAKKRTAPVKRKSKAADLIEKVKTVLQQKQKVKVRRLCYCNCVGCTIGPFTGNKHPLGQEVDE